MSVCGIQRDLDPYPVCFHNKDIKRNHAPVRITLYNIQEKLPANPEFNKILQ